MNQLLHNPLVAEACPDAVTSLELLGTAWRKLNMAAMEQPTLTAAAVALQVRVQGWLWVWDRRRVWGRERVWVGVSMGTGRGVGTGAGDVFSILIWRGADDGIVLICFIVVSF